MELAPKIFISGGNVGADSIPFSVYEELGASLQGFMPKGFHRADGRGREVAARHGLREGEGGNAWRDRHNAKAADAVLAFLTTLPMTGRGTMQTVALMVSGRYEHVELVKPADRDHVVLLPTSARGKPAIVFWDVSGDRVGPFARALRGFVRDQRPRALMVSGPLEDTWPGIEGHGAQILRRAFMEPGLDAAFAAADSGAGAAAAGAGVCAVCDGERVLLRDPCPLCCDWARREWLPEPGSRPFRAGQRA